MFFFVLGFGGIGSLMVVGVEMLGSRMGLEGVYSHGKRVKEAAKSIS